MSSRAIVDPEFDLLTERQAAKLVKVLPHTLTIWRCHGRPAPPHIRLGRKVYYRRCDLRDWIAAQVVRTSAAHREEMAREGTARS
jgi:hypothetical protein